MVNIKLNLDMLDTCKVPVLPMIGHNKKVSTFKHCLCKKNLVALFTIYKKKRTFAFYNCILW